MKYILNQLILEKKKTTYSSVLNCYGFGDKKSKKLNAILLNHPNSKEFKHDLNKLIRSKEGKTIFNVSSESSVKSQHFSNLLKKAEIKSYKAFRQFQNLPSRGQRTHTNSQTSKKQLNPMARLNINKEITENFFVKFKKLELLKNGRSEEYNSFLKNQVSKRKVSKNKFSKKEKDKFKKKLKLKNKTKKKKKK